MRCVYHLVLPELWEMDTAGDYRTASLETQEFIHCANADQVARSANRYYADAADLFLLHIDPVLLTSPLRDEPAASGELFPHIHGPINRSAVIRVERLRRGTDGRWHFSI